MLGDESLQVPQPIRPRVRFRQNRAKLAVDLSSPIHHVCPHTRQGAVCYLDPAPGSCRSQAMIRKHQRGQKAFQLAVVLLVEDQGWAGWFQAE